MEGRESSFEGSGGNSSLLESTVEGSSGRLDSSLPGSAGNPEGEETSEGGKSF